MTTDQKNVGQKFDGGKPRITLLPMHALKEVLKCLEYGAKKYGDNNWVMVPHLKDRYFNAAFRHMMDYRMGEIPDPESGVAHLAHAITSLLFILEAEVAPEFGIRPTLEEARTAAENIKVIGTADLF